MFLLIDIFTDFNILEKHVENRFHSTTETTTKNASVFCRITKFYNSYLVRLTLYIFFLQLFSIIIIFILLFTVLTISLINFLLIYTM